MIKIEEKLLNEIYAEAEKTYPNEGCGFVLGTVDGGRNAVQFIAVENIQDKLHAQDPKRYPREAKTAYAIDPKAMEAIEKDAKAKGLSIISIFHSHPEHGVYFSDEDKGMAAPWGEPLFPHLSYLVVSVYSGKVKNSSEFLWSTDKKDFVEHTIL
ncbi:M67 family metallopeptidase [bacterium]|nr:M67 family metallopeptidase [bacterium]